MTLTKKWCYYTWLLSEEAERLITPPLWPQAPPTRSHQSRDQSRGLLSAVGALLAQQAGELPPPGLCQALHLGGRPLPQRPPLLLEAAAVRLLHAGHDGCVKHVLQVLLGQRRALAEADGAQLLRQLPSLLSADCSLLVLGQADQHLHVLPLVQLGAHQDQRRPGAVLLDLGNPPADQVAERAGSDHAVAQEEDVCVPVAQRSETLQFILQEATDRRFWLEPSRTRLFWQCLRGESILMLTGRNGDVSLKEEAGGQGGGAP